MTIQTAVQQGLRIGELAAATCLSTETIRYYEKAGLLPPPARTPAGYRTFGPEAVDRLHFIRGAQRLGLRLEDIGNLLTIRDTGTCPCEPAADFLAQRLVEVDTQIRRLETLRTEMTAMLQALPAGDCPQPAPGTWLPPEGR
jgi:DNA-binding transcriptional MerR regulator